MTTLQIIIRKIAVHFSKPIWSFVRNCVFWLFHLNKIGAVRKEMEAIKGLKIETLMGLFKWTADKYGDWYPWVSTLLANEMKDDCDGAATLRLGSTANGNDVKAATAIAASGFTTWTIDKTFSLTADQTLYLNDETDGNWNSSSLTATLYFRRVN